MDFFEDSPPSWICKFSLEPYQGDPVRGYWVLHVPLGKAQQKWDKFTKMVESGRLGYMISSYPEPMSFGAYEGYISICCFALLGERQELLETLDKTGFSKYLTTKGGFRLVKKFKKLEQEMFGYFLDEYDF